ncbi:hypothetical protein WCLP8_50031 [uncultured Gammaproteobacteria bacterium]
MRTVDLFLEPMLGLPTDAVTARGTACGWLARVGCVFFRCHAAHSPPTSARLDRHGDDRPQ